MCIVQVMAIEHKDLPLAAVQFHPESILTNPKTGLQMLANCFRYLTYLEEEKNKRADKGLSR